MKLSDILNESTITEGVSVAPQTEEQAKKLAALLSKPLLAKNSGDLFGLWDDDGLHNVLDETKRKDGGDTDVSYMVKDWVKREVKPEQIERMGWKKPWDPKALEILRNL